METEVAKQESTSQHTLLKVQIEQYCLRVLDKNVLGSYRAIYITDRHKDKKQLSRRAALC